MTLSILARHGRVGSMPLANPVEIIDGVARLTLSQGLLCFVDAADYPLVKEQHWVASVGKRTSVLMHRVLMGLARGERCQVDHEDGNGLNNRRSNLRRATVSQNAMNRRKGKIKSSQYKGVRFCKECPNRPWQAYVTINRKQKYLGHFATEREAALTYNEAALKFYGEFANLNLLE